MMKRLPFILIALLAGLGLAPGLELANPDLLDRLDARDQALLEDQQLVGHTTGYDQIYTVYQHAAEDDLPILVTTDPLLHVFHILYDYSLRTAELDHFYPRVQRMLQFLIQHQEAQLKQTGDSDVKAALRANVAYLSVPLSYLDPGFKPPARALAQVRAEQALIDAHAGFDTSKVLGVLEDFSQYQPRGHYTRSDEFSRFFKAMMYLGRMTFLLSDPSNPELGLRLTRQAILVGASMRFQAGPSDTAPEQLWNQVYEPTAWMVGESEDPLPRDYDSLLTVVAGDTKALDWVANDANVREFIGRAESLPSPRIISTRVLDFEPKSKTKGMRLMSQRYIPDSDMFQQLVYDKVGTQDNPRLMPMGLDITAVLGSGRAREHLMQVYHQDRFANYLSQLDSLRGEYENLGLDQWLKNCYYGWLYALKLNLEPVSLPDSPSHIADFTRSPAYADKTLVSSCGSWAELRHDTILYAKQSYTVEATAVPPQPRPLERVAYVEPKPGVFRQLGWLCSELHARLKTSGLVHPELDYKLERFVTVANRLADIAGREIQGTWPTQDDCRFCKGLGEELEFLTTFAPSGPEPGRYTSEEDSKMALVSDVHTDPNTGQVLQEAVGNPVQLFAVIPHEGREYLAIGACFSYYEFTRPMAERMTDAEWQELDPKPNLPVWTQSFITR